MSGSSHSRRARAHRRYELAIGHHAGVGRCRPLPPYPAYRQRRTLDYRSWMGRSGPRGRSGRFLPAHGIGGDGGWVTVGRTSSPAVGVAVRAVRVSVLVGVGVFSHRRPIAHRVKRLSPPCRRRGARTSRSAGNARIGSLPRSRRRSAGCSCRRPRLRAARRRNRPGSEILTLQPRKRWTYAKNEYLSGEIPALVRSRVSISNGRWPAGAARLLVPKTL